MGDIGDPYITVDDLKAYLRQGAELSNKIAPGVANALLDDLFEDAIAAASNEIETEWCGRQFNKTDTATARLYTPISGEMCLVDDFHTTTDLVVKIDQDDDGVYETTLSTSDYTLQPSNGVVDGQPGWPYCRIKIRERASYWFPCAEESVEVTAKWGWAAVPENVKAACRMLAHDNYKSKDNPFGVAGFSEFGVVRMRNNHQVEKKLKKYQRRKLAG